MIHFHEESMDYNSQNQMGPIFQQQQSSTYMIQAPQETTFKFANNQEATNCSILFLNGDFPTLEVQESQSTISRTRIKRKHGEPYTCDHCSKTFLTGSALGGHKSRVHPSQSKDYKQKINTALKRAPVRERTKEIQFIIYNDLFLS